VPRLLLIVSGGIAAYKALEFVRLARAAGHTVTGVLTEAGARFLTPLSLQAITEAPVHTDLWSLTEESRMGHIQLSRDADLLVVAPASADILASMAAGRAHDLATTLLLATDAPVLVAPAMNVRMWLHPATQANLALLGARGVHVAGPDTGPMACNEYGPGRLVEPPVLLAAVEAALAAGAALAGRHILITAGPTQEPIDAVRYIGNRSSGLQGYAIAAACRAAGARVTLVSGPTALDPPPGVTFVRADTAEQMLAAVRAALPADAAVLAAAVADWRAARPRADKFDKAAGPPPIDLVPTPDILASLAAPGPLRPRLVVGFAAETHDLAARAAAKRLRKGCDWILGNDVSEQGGAMGGPRNRIHLVTEAGTEDWPELAKEEVARRLADRLAAALHPPIAA
jgi:phosphopantothenoylcysteine decarboxylase / phosphopantothenate---cysteine ligase